MGESGVENMGSENSNAEFAEASGSTPLDPDRSSAMWRDGHGRPIGIHSDKRRVLHLRASSLGTCPKALAIESTGEARDSIPPALQAAFDQGHALEVEILDGWKAQAVDQVQGAGVVEYQEQARVSVPFMDGRVLVSGSLDLLAIRTDLASDSIISVAIVDAKGMSTKLTEQYPPGPKTRTYMLDKYSTQLGLYATGIRAQHPLIIPIVFVAVGRVDRAAGVIAGPIEVYRYSVAEVESANADKDFLQRIEAAFRLSIKAGIEGVKALANEDCMSNAYSCPMARWHNIVQPSRDANDEAPEEVREALETLAEIQAARGDEVKTHIKSEKTLKAVVRKWLDGMGDDGIGKRVIGDWEVKFSEGESKEVVEITPDELRELVKDERPEFPVVAEDFITTKPGRKTMTTTHLGGWTA